MDDWTEELKECREGEKACDWNIERQLKTIMVAIDNLACLKGDLSRMMTQKKMTQKKIDRLLRHISRVGKAAQ